MAKNKASEFKVVIGLGNNHTKHLMDSGSGLEVEFSHRLPTNRERIRYQNEAVAIKGKKMVIKSQGAARHLVKQLLTSFRFPNADPNTWLHVEKDKEMVPVSCEATAPGFVSEWRELFEKVAPGMLENLGMQVFAGVSDADSNIEFDHGYGDEEEEGDEESPSVAISGQDDKEADPTTL